MKILKRVLLALVVLVVLLVGAVASFIVPIFAGSLPIADDAEVGPGVRQVKDGYVSVFIIDGGNGSLGMIDCGNDPEGTAILAALKAKGQTADQVGSIFLTHGHPDHTAACHKFPKAEVYAFPQDVLLAGGQDTAKGFLPHLMGPMPENKRIKVTKLLQEGQEVSVGTLNVRALATPGHTGGSASYLVNGVLVLGDNATGKNDGVHLAPKPFSDDPQVNKESIARLYEHLKAEGSVKTLAFAHSGPIQGIDALGTPKE